MNPSSSPIKSLNAALAAHTAWKQRFCELMESRFDLNPDQVGLTTICKFGQWLEGEGKALLSPDDYLSLDQLHSQFHQIASQIVRLKQAGYREQVQFKLKSGGELYQASTRIMSRLRIIRQNMESS
jgi:Chemoreceptor zinc-binding domain